MNNERMVLDELMPNYSAVITEHRIVDAEPRLTYAAARDLDFMTVHTPLLDLAFWVRTLPARLRGRLAPPPPQARLTGGAGAGMPGWMLLGERPGEELAFGAVGVFWGSEIRWQQVPPEAFAAFDEPGFGKIACNFSVRPYGTHRSMLTFDCRVALTDPVSQRGFDRYWRLVRPFVGHIMRAALAAIATEATRETAPTNT